MAGEVAGIVFDHQLKTEEFERVHFRGVRGAEQFANSLFERIPFARTSSQRASDLSAAFGPIRHIAGLTIDLSYIGLSAFPRSLFANYIATWEMSGNPSTCIQTYDSESGTTEMTCSCAESLYTNEQLIAQTRTR